jgi:hypothetical protein
MSKTVSMSIGEFMGRKDSKSISHLHKFVTYPLVTVVFHPTGASAATSYQKGDLTGVVNESAAPIFDLFRAAGLPVAGIILSWAAFQFMADRPEKGWRLVKGTGIGYIVLNLVPFGLQLLTDIGDQISK